MSEAQLPDPTTADSGNDTPPDSDVMQRVAAALEATESGPAASITRAVSAEAPLPPRRR
jgi:hypothetical protein